MEPAKTQPDGVTPVISVIGGGIEVTGNIEASVDLQLEGIVNGDVRCTTLILGESSVIRGNVYAHRVRASGIIEGAIDTQDLAIEATARLSGDITYSRVRMANGAIVEGKLMHRPAAEEDNDAKGLRLVEPVRPGSPGKPKSGAIHIE
jgi:cytoskeletal protein CcmA (bactofilin family)